MQVLYFTAVAIGLYLLSDWLLNRIELRLGRRLPYRSLVFFAILLTLALSSFHLLGLLGAS